MSDRRTEQENERIVRAFIAAWSRLDPSELAAFFSEDGIYREGSHYYIFSFINFVPFLYHYRNVSSVDLFPDFQPAFEAPVAMRSSRGWMPMTEDSYLRPYPSFMIAAAYKGAKTYLLPEGDLSQVLAWNWETTDMEAFHESERTTGFNYSGASWDYSKPLLEFLTYDPTVKAVQPSHSPTVFLDSGVSILRSGWTDPVEQQRFLMFQGIAEADNHQHFDHLSFTFSAVGQMMGSDSGYSRKSYGEAIRTEWYRTARAHNVITVDGEAPIDHAPSVPPTMKHRIDTDYFDFEEKIAIYATGGTHSRAVAFPGEDYFVVADIVDLPSPREISVLFHGGRSTLSGEGSQRTWRYEDDSYGNAAVLHSLHLGGGSARIGEHEGEVTYIKGDYALYPYLSLDQTTDKEAFLQIFVPTSVGAAAPQMRDLSGADFRAAEVKRGDATDVFIAQANRQPVSTGGFETDGTFAFYRKAAKGESIVAVRDATYVRIPSEHHEWTFHEPTTFASKIAEDGTLTADAGVPEMTTGRN